MIQRVCHVLSLTHRQCACQDGQVINRENGFTARRDHIKVRNALQPRNFTPNRTVVLDDFAAAQFHGHVFAASENLSVWPISRGKPGSRIKSMARHPPQMGQVEMGTRRARIGTRIFAGGLPPARCGPAPVPCADAPSSCGSALDVRRAAPKRCLVAHGQCGGAPNRCFRALGRCGPAPGACAFAPGHPY